MQRSCRCHFALFAVWSVTASRPARVSQCDVSVMSALQFSPFFRWPLTIISKTCVRSIIRVSMSMMSGCSLAPLMNSSSVSSPAEVNAHFKEIKPKSFALHSSHRDKITGLMLHASVTFPIDVNLLVYKSHNLFWRDVVASGNILNGLKELRENI